MIQPEILKELNLSQFVALDIETTGLDNVKDDIIEVGAVRFHEGVSTETLQLLIRPSREIPLHITRLTGISNDMVEHAATFSEVADQIISFIGQSPLVAHNVGFDLGFLQEHISRLKNYHSDDRQWALSTNDIYDTVLLAKIYLPFQSSFSLGKLSEYFNIQIENHHRALPDAEAAARIFLQLLEIAVRTEFKDVRKILEILDPSDDPTKIFFMRLQGFLASGKYHIEPSLDKESVLYSTHLYNIIGEDDTPEAGHLQLEDISAEEISRFFDIGGEMEKSFGKFEHRQSQIQMAGAVAETFNKSQFLVVEAGTGTGKSLAYLLPAIRWSIQNYGPYGRVVISTNTKNLQEQLFFKDLPILHSILKEKFKAVLLKGKANYLCLDKWFTILSDLKYRLTPYERIKILPLFMWLKQTETGDISENNGFAADRNPGLWSKFIAEDNYCPGRSCKYYKDCFLWRARNNAKDAHLVLVNHSLLFSDLVTDHTVLNEYVNVILDEAHNIEKVATEYLGAQITIWDFKETFQKLYSKERFETGILIQLRKRIQLSEMENSQKELVFGHIDTIIPLISTTWTMAQGFFRELTAYLRSMIPDMASNDYSVRFRYRSSDGIYTKLETYYLEINEYLNRLYNGIHDLLELFREIAAESFTYQKQMYQELLAQYTKLDGLRNNLHFLIQAEMEDWVYWFELPSRADSDDSRLYTVPLKISEILQEQFYSKLKSAVFTSATLTVGKKFDYFKERIGLNYLEPERLQTYLLDSPFDYTKQVLILIPSYFPDPRAANYRATLKEFLLQLQKEQKRGTLVLFTSYSMLNDVYQALRLSFESEQIPLLAQGISGSRYSIINEFKKNTHSFLLGTDSFWEGVDIPGNALEILLLTKIPFDVPSDPIIQAKAEMIEREGGNPFMDYTVPEAVIKFRQGFGRLIRSTTDTGVVIILDNRIIKKIYGRIFLESLPVSAKISDKDEEIWELLLNWFQNIRRNS
ncbi:MAG: 3'-5' exoribonuclease [bacterium]|nr:MAG: 3'-5' exoribonuclease [bacterium]